MSVTWEVKSPGDSSPCAGQASHGFFSSSSDFSERQRLLPCYQTAWELSTSGWPGNAGEGSRAHDALEGPFSEGDRSGRFQKRFLDPVRRRGQAGTLRDPLDELQASAPLPLYVPTTGSIPVRQACVESFSRTLCSVPCRTRSSLSQKSEGRLAAGGHDRVPRR